MSVVLAAWTVLKKVPDPPIFVTTSVLLWKFRFQHIELIVLGFLLWFLLCSLLFLWRIDESPLRHRDSKNLCLAFTVLTLVCTSPGLEELGFLLFVLLFLWRNDALPFRYGYSGIYKNFCLAFTVLSLVRTSPDVLTVCTPLEKGWFLHRVRSVCTLWDLGLFKVAKKADSRLFDVRRPEDHFLNPIFWQYTTTYAWLRSLAGCYVGIASEWYSLYT